MMTYCQLDVKEQTSVRFESKHTEFLSYNASENIVGHMAVILFRLRRVPNILCVCVCVCVWIKTVFVKQSPRNKKAHFIRAICL